MTLFAVSALQCIVIGEENPSNCPFPWDFVTLPEEDRATTVGSMHKNLVRVARVAPEICWRTDRRTDRDTQTHSSQYFDPAGEVKI